MIIRFLREKAPWLVTGFLVAALLAFILGQLGSNKLNMHNHAEDSPVGSIGDKTIGYEEFNAELKALIQEKRQLIKEMNPLYEAVIYLSSVQEVWNKFKYKFLLDEAKSKLGIGVGRDELFDLVEGTDIDPDVKLFFGVSSTDSMDVTIVRDFLNKIGNEGAEPQLSRAWANFEKYLVDKHSALKYSAIIANGWLENALQQNSEAAFKDADAKLDYTFIPFEKISPAPEVSESTAREYYERYKDRFKLDQELRSVKYISIAIAPSPTDIEKTTQLLNLLKPKFAASSQTELFMSSNTEAEGQIEYKTKEELERMSLSELFTTPNNSVYGPYLAGSVYKLTKLLDCRPRYREVKLRHILLPANTDQPTIKELVGKLAKGNKKFSEAAQEVSIDPRAKTNHGELGWVNIAMPLPASIREECFVPHKERIVVVKSPLGVHIFEILATKGLAKRAQIATITKCPVAGQQTRKKLFELSAAVEADLKQGQSMEEVAAKYKVPYFHDSQVSAWGPYQTEEIIKHRKLVKWAFSLDKLGAVSPILEESDSYTLGMLEQVYKKGVPPFNDIKEEIDSIAQEEEWAHKVQDSVCALSNKGAEVKEIAQTFKTDVKKETSSAAFMSNNCVRGAVLGATVGKTVAVADRQNRGVFVLRLSSKNSDDSSRITNFDKTESSLDTNVLIDNAIKLLEANTKITDNRLKFF